MNLSTRELVIIRDRLHNLDWSNPENLARYKHWRYVYFCGAEEAWSWAYDDATKDKVRDNPDVRGNVTVGIGFNMNRGQDARDEWNKAFEGEESPPDFDAIKEGRKHLTNAQIEKLFNQSITQRERELAGIYGSCWKKLRANERLAIESAYYPGSKTADRNSRFYGYMKKYYETGEERYFDNAILEIEKYSNPKKNKGIARRRRAEALMLRSMDCPLYSKPGEPLCPQRALTAKEGITLLSHAVDTWPRPTSAEDGDYYIWRTQEDERVRDDCRSHANRICAWKDPKITNKPGEAEGCRCNAEPVPHLITVIPRPAKAPHRKDMQPMCMCTDETLLIMWQVYERLRDIIAKMPEPPVQQRAA